jgi:tRNA A22 N-methylase
MWKVSLPSINSTSENGGQTCASDAVTVERAGRVKTNVADVSSMAVLEEGDGISTVVVCGVGMEVLCVGWE